MANRSYNSVGAGETPRLGAGDRGQVADVARPGGNGQHAKNVTISTDIPSVARPGGPQGGNLKGAGDPPPAARPGGPQGVHKSTSSSSKYPSPD